jgi:hypothetical protein
MVGEYDFVVRMYPTGVVPTCELTVSAVSTYEVPAAAVAVDLTFAEYGPLTLTEESIVMSGSIDSGVFTGACSKGALTLQWNAGRSLWLLTFDAPTAPPGVPAVNEFYEEMFGSGDSETFDDPYGDYLEHSGAPYPNWSGTVSPL